MKEILLRYSGPQWLLPLCIILFLSACVVFFRRNRESRNAAMNLIVALDAVFFLFLLFFLFNPVLVYKTGIRKRPEAKMFLDVSESCRSFRKMVAFTAHLSSELKKILGEKGYRFRVVHFGNGTGDERKPENDILAADSILDSSRFVPGSSSVSGSIALLLSDGRFRYSGSVSSGRRLPLYTFSGPRLRNNSYVRKPVLSRAGKETSLCRMRLNWFSAGPALLKVYLDDRLYHTARVAGGEGGMTRLFRTARGRETVVRISLETHNDSYPADNKAAAVYKAAREPVRVLLINGLPSPEAAEIMRVLKVLGDFRVTSTSSAAPAFLKSLDRSDIVILIRPDNFLKSSFIRRIARHIRSGKVLLYVHGEGGKVSDSLLPLLSFRTKSGTDVRSGEYPWEQVPGTAFAVLPSGLPEGDHFEYLLSPVSLPRGAQVHLFAASAPALTGMRYGKGYSAALLAGPVRIWDRIGLAYSSGTFHAHRFYASLFRSLMRLCRRNTPGFSLSAGRVLPGQRIRVNLFTRTGAGSYRLRFRSFTDGTMTTLPALRRDRSGMWYALFSLDRYACGLIEYNNGSGWMDSGMRLICTMQNTERSAGCLNSVLSVLSQKSGGSHLTQDRLNRIPDAGPGRIVLQSRHLKFIHSTLFIVVLVLLLLFSILLRWRKKE